MSFFCPEKYKVALPNVNQQLTELKGTLEPKQAQMSLIKFLRHNLYVAVELFAGIQLAPFQEITLKAWFNRNFSLCVWGRGGSKSTMAAYFCFLYPLFNPGAKIIIAGPTFRTARHIFSELEKIVESPNGVILAQAFGYKAKRNDLFEWRLTHPNGDVSTISAIPLSGDKVRGFRANVLIIDEFLLMPQDIVDAVLSPFLSVPIDVAQRMRVRALEDRLIQLGRMKEEERMIFDNKVRVIFLSSASFTFEYLYQKYCEWINIIMSPSTKETSTYFVSQMSYEAVPEHMLSQEVIEAAKEGGISDATFRREYGAQFIDDSEGYYSAKKMLLCTVPDGEEPSIRLWGEKGKKYIISIDPDLSNSNTADFFAIAVFELDEGSESPTLVHNYGIAGNDLKDHINYFFYLMQAFNPELIIIDNAGYQFIESAVESSKFKEAGINLDFFELDSDLDGPEYELALKEARKQYNKKKVGGKICIKRYFSPDFIRNSNGFLQTSIDFKKIFFASRLNPNGAALTRQLSHQIDSSLIKNSIQGLNEFGDTLGSALMTEFVDNQDNLMNMVKKQCALIEIKTTIKGTLSFDLPLHLKRSTSPERARKDNYTALLLGAWGVKCYFDLHKRPAEKGFTFIPQVIK